MGKPRFLTYAECAAWCAERDYPVITNIYGHLSPALKSSFTGSPLEYPVDSGKKVIVAQSVITESIRGGDVLLWIADWSVWDNHMPLFTRLREALGETRPLIDAPGQVFGAENADDAISVLACALFFHWDCHVLCADGGPAYFCSHDEYSLLMVRPGGEVESPETYKAWGLDLDKLGKR